MPEFPERLYHGTPPWVPSCALFHIRIRVARDNAVPLTDPAISCALLAAAERYQHLGHWWCELFLLMPDHLHALLRFPREARMTETIRQWKRGTARFQHVSWQDNFFDNRLRNEKEA
jgi:putative transposase